MIAATGVACERSFMGQKSGKCPKEIATTPEYQRSRCERKKVEMPFAHLKSILKLGRLRLRGLTGATDEFTLAGITQNLRRMEN